MMSSIYMQRLWSTPGDFCQRQWAQLYNLFGQNDLMITVLGTFIFTGAVFWISNIFFIILDVTGWPAYFLKYKVQPDKNQPLKLSALMKAVKVALFNQIVVGIPYTWVLCQAMKWRGCSCAPEDMPAAPRILLELAVFTVFEEIGFYYAHRLIHHPRLYKHYHKQHHEWTAPIGVVAIYAHPVEHIFANILPPSIGPLLMGSHLSTVWLFWAIVLHITVVHHSGYHLPFLSSSEAHDFHHFKFNTNYGALGILDRLHGTDALFRESVAYKRHFRSFSLTPVSQRVPESIREKRK